MDSFRQQANNEKAGESLVKGDWKIDDDVYTFI